MPAPSTAITRLDLSMTTTEFSALQNRLKFIGHKVFPHLPVNTQNNTFRRLPAEALLPPVADLTRALKGSYKRDDFEWETDTYQTQEYGCEELTDDRQLAMYSEFDAERINRDRVVTRLSQVYEVACAAAAFDSAYFTGAYTIDIDATDGGHSGHKWSVANSADPIQDIDLARQQFITNCGHAPNALVLEETALIACMRSQRIEDVVKYTGTLDAMTARRLVPQLADVFRLDQIIVAEAPIKNTAGRGQAPAYSRIWDTTKALLCRVDDTRDLESAAPCVGRTIQWTEEADGFGADDPIGIIIEEYREESRRGGVIRGRTDYQIKRLHKPAGLLLTNVL